MKEMLVQLLTVPMTEDLRSATAECNPKRKWYSSVKLLGPVLVAILSGLAFLTFPHEPLTGALDPSWAAILSYAHQRGIQFGTDIIFSYGPLGFLITPYFTGHAIRLRLLTDVTLCFGVALAFCMWLRRLDFWWRALGILLFTLLVSNARYGTQDLIIDLGLVAMSLLCVFSRRGPPLVWVFGLCSLAAFGALAKFSLLLTSAATIAMISAEMILREKVRYGFATAAGYLSLFLAGWELSGQHLKHLPVFIARSWLFSKDFAAVMALDSPFRVAVGASVSAMLMIALILIISYSAFSAQDRNFNFRRGLLAVWLLLLLFVNLKHGLVRPDAEHSFFFFGFVPLVAFLLLGVSGAGVTCKSWARGICALTALACVLTLRTSLYPRSVNPGVPVMRAVESCENLIRPDVYCREMDTLLSAERQRALLPKIDRQIGRASVDVFGNCQAFAVFNDLNYTPRPLLQSYAAYTPPLMQTDAHFYRSKAAPEFTLLRLVPLDHRFPAIEDALVLRQLLIDDDFCQTEGPFVLLRSKRAIEPALTLLRRGTVAWGQKIDLSSFGRANLWLQLDVEPSALGRVWQFLYKPSQTWLVVWSGRKAADRYEAFRAPPPMLKAGFLASPLLKDNSDVIALYHGGELVHPSAFALVTDQGAKRLWNPIIQFRLYQVENELGGSGSARSKNALSMGE